MIAKADLHIHVNNNISHKSITNILKEAEKNNLKAVSLIEHFSINLYYENDVLENIIKSEGIEKYFSGKVVSGVEVVCSAQEIRLIDNIDINNRILHILMYDFNPITIRKIGMFSEKAQVNNFYEDVSTLSKMATKLGLSVPPPEYFNHRNGSCFAQLQSYIESNEKIKEQYLSTLGHFSGKSDFIRNYIQNPKGSLFFAPKSIPTIIDLLKFAKINNCKLVIAHPAYMLENINFKNYIDALIELTYQSEQYQKFWAIEGPYMLNSPEETSALIEIARQNKITYTCGSDSRHIFDDKTQEIVKMYYADKQTNEKMFYTPKPGLAIRAHLETGNGNLEMPTTAIDSLNDVREYYKETFQNGKMV